MHGVAKASASMVGLGVAMLLGAQALAQATGALEITIKGFEGKKGQAHVTLYQSEDTWLKVDKALETKKLPIQGDTVKLKLDGLKPGTYGVSVIHDANKNDELDMRWFPFPKPKEGTGASRDPQTKMGPPKWQDASFQLDAGETKPLEIKIVYL